MLRLPKALGLARLALLLSVVPCIRGCDDARGLSQTAGFPLPFSARTNADSLFMDVDWTTVGINALLFVALGYVLLTRLPALASRLASTRVLLVGIVAAAAATVPRAPGIDRAPG